jgi:hypothetical protein
VFLEFRQQADLPFEEPLEGVLLAHDGGPLAFGGQRGGDPRHARRLQVPVEVELVLLYQVVNLVHRRLDQFRLQGFLLGVVGFHVL